MKLIELEKVLNNELSITIKDLAKDEGETWSSDYIDFSYIEEEKLEKEVVNIDTWISAHSEKAYYIIIK